MKRIKYETAAIISVSAAFAAFQPSQSEAKSINQNVVLSTYQIAQLSQPAARNAIGNSKPNLSRRGGTRGSWLEDGPGWAEHHKGDFKEALPDPGDRRNTNPTRR